MKRCKDGPGETVGAAAKAAAAVVGATAKAAVAAAKAVASATAAAVGRLSVHVDLSFGANW